MTSTATHTLAGIESLHQGKEFVAWCSCGVGFWEVTEDRARTAWKEKHIDRIASTPQGDVDEADSEQYDREEDQRLDQQLGKYI